MVGAEDATSVATPAPSTVLGTDHAGVSDDTIVVTADRQAVPLARTTASIDVVTQADDRLAGYQPFAFDWLKDLPGVDIIQGSGGFAGAVQIRLRGSAAAETKVLEDGIPVADPTGISGNPQIELLSPAGLDRIEVVRGAQSGLYGSSAIGGVVNLISVRPTAEPIERLRIEGGSFGTSDADAQASGPIAPWLGYALGISALNTAGFASQTNPGENGNPAGLPKDGFRRIDLNTRIEAHDQAGLDSAYLSFRAGDSSTDLDINGPLAPVERQTVESWRTSGGGTVQLCQHLSLSGDLAYTNIDRTYPDDAATYDDRTFDSHETYGAVRLRFDVVPNTVLTLGSDTTVDSATTTLVGGIPDLDVSSHGTGIWGEARFSLPRLELSGVLRHDTFSGYGSDDTYRLGVACFPVGELLKLFASTGTGFRAPSLYERYAAFYGNPDLEAQTSTSYEIGQSITLRDTSLRLTDTWFRTSYHRQITFDPVTFVSINLPSDSHIEGIENGLRWGISPIDIGVTYTWQHSDDGTGTPLPMLPANKISGDMVLHVFSSSYLRVVVERDWSRVAGGIEERPYTVLGASAGYTIITGWDVYVRGDNLANAHYEIYPLATTEPRAVFVGTTATF
jgi:vitamin B12 transporter